MSDRPWEKFLNSKSPGPHIVGGTPTPAAAGPEVSVLTLSVAITDEMKEKLDRLEKKVGIRMGNLGLHAMQMGLQSLLIMLGDEIETARIEQLLQGGA